MEKFDKATAFKNGSTELSMKDNGTKTKPKEKEPFGTLKVTFTQAILEPIRQMDLAYILMLMEVGMKDNGSMMFKKDKEKKSGSTVQNTQENIQME